MDAAGGVAPLRGVTGTLVWMQRGERPGKESPRGGFLCQLNSLDRYSHSLAAVWQWQGLEITSTHVEAPTGDRRWRRPCLLTMEAEMERWSRGGGGQSGRGGRNPRGWSRGGGSGKRRRRKRSARETGKRMGRGGEDLLRGKRGSESRWPAALGNRVNPGGEFTTVSEAASE